MHRQHLAIIGSGASSIYLLKHLLDEVDVFKPCLGTISIFEKNRVMGVGMPYSPETTDRYNMSNICSEELPPLPMTLGDWLRAQDPAELRQLGVDDPTITDTEVYSRLALGRYLNEQYRELIGRLHEHNIAVREHPHCEIVDVVDTTEAGIRLITASQEIHRCDRLIIATGHHWPQEDQPEKGNFASPWPIRKLLPEPGGHLDFTVGTLGASLSAFDVISSLAHRHGKFVKDSFGSLRFLPDPGTEKFRMRMHSAQGLLPHLQFAQVEPRRVIYRHVEREGMLALIDAQGFLRLDAFFDQVCRPALISAFEKDGMSETARCLSDPHFELESFVERMTGKHEYTNAFEGMRAEMVEARDSVLNKKPIHWKEVLDDLMYTLNFHAELMPAEDHLRLKAHVMPFLMNVIAAMPLPSGDTLLALYDAGKLDIVAGKVTVCDSSEDEATRVEIDDEGTVSSMSYAMFVDCSGQKPLELEEYPFPSLVKGGTVRKARASFRDVSLDEAALPESARPHLFREDGRLWYHTGGIDVDAAFRVICHDGTPSPRIWDISFPHISGVRPYSYGLQACSDTGAVLVKAWADQLKKARAGGNIVEVSEIYEELGSSAEK